MISGADLFRSDELASGKDARARTSDANVRMPAAILESGFGRDVRRARWQMGQVT
jgi:hypothetical protein